MVQIVQKEGTSLPMTLSKAIAVGRQHINGAIIIDEETRRVIKVITPQQAPRRVVQFTAKRCVVCNGKGLNEHFIRDSAGKAIDIEWTDCIDCKTEGFVTVRKGR